MHMVYIIHVDNKTSVTECCITISHVTPYTVDCMVRLPVSYLPVDNGII